MHNNNKIIFEVDIDKLDDDLWDSRDYSNPDNIAKAERRVQQLATNIKDEGLHTPILIALPKKHNGHYSIVYGRLRTRAHKKLGLKKIKCILTNETDKNKLKDMTFSENYQRLDLSLDDQIYRIISMFEDEGFTSKQVMQLSKKIYNDANEGRGNKHIPKKFLELMEHVPPINNENKRPSPNYLYQIMQTVVQLDPKVQEHIRKNKLSMAKRIMLTNKKLREHPDIQITLIDTITGLSGERAKLEINQAIRDFETGAISKHGNDYVMDFSLREKIDPRIRTLRNSYENYMELLKQTNKIMYTLTGHKIARGESKYKQEHIDYTEVHRIDILKGLEPKQIVNLHNDLTMLVEALNSFLDIMEQDEKCKEKNEGVITK